MRGKEASESLNELWHFTDVDYIYWSTLSKTREWGSRASWRHTEVQAPATRSGFGFVMAMDKNTCRNYNARMYTLFFPHGW